MLHFNIGEKMSLFSKQKKSFKKVEDGLMYIACYVLHVHSTHILHKAARKEGRKRGGLSAMKFNLSWNSLPFEKGEGEEEEGRKKRYFFFS